VGDPEQPAGQPACRVEGGEAAESLDEGFLGQVLRKRAVLRHPRDEADDRPLIAAHNLLEGRLGAPKRLGDQPGLAYCLEIDRDVGSSLNIFCPFTRTAYAERSAGVAARGTVLMAEPAGHRFVDCQEAVSDLSFSTKAVAECS